LTHFEVLKFIELENSLLPPCSYPFCSRRSRLSLPPRRTNSRPGSRTK